MVFLLHTRISVRSRMERYPEKSFMKIVKVEALPEPVYKKVSNPELVDEHKDIIRLIYCNQFKITQFQNRKYEPAIPFIDEDRKCRVWVEKVFRGKKLEKISCIESVSYKNDYRLIPKHEEADYKDSEVPMKLISPIMSLPPLLREFVMKETGESDPLMPVKCKKGIMTNSRLAKDGEKADIHLAIGLGKPSEKCRYLYDGAL